MNTTQTTIGFIGKCTCKGCKTVLRVNIPAYERKERRGYRYSHLVTVLRANEHPNDRQICCAEHKRYLFFRQIDGKLNPDHVCDSRCTGARGHSCECSCGGANHGMAYCR